MPLTDVKIRQEKPRSKAFKLFDGEGLYLEIAPAGGKWWRLKYRFAGKEKRISLGVYPTIGLKEARERREEAKKLLAQGIDPGTQRKEARASVLAAEREEALTFRVVAREWYDKRTTELTPGYRKQLFSRIENQLLPYIGNIQIARLKPRDVIEAVSHAEKKGNIETAHRLAQLASQICRYAKNRGYVESNVAAELTEALPHVQKQHYATITDPAKVGGLLRSIDDYPGDISVLYALKLLPYVFLRSKEIRGAEWSEINFDSAEWVIPAIRMKSVKNMRSPHTVPLARQVIELLRNLQEINGGGRLLFPSPFNVNRQISDMGLLNALRRMGYSKDEMTIHGFRGMASTLLNEQGYRAEVIEAQLSHHERNSVRAAYNHATYMDERKKMMQEWADYLDELRAGAGPSA